MKILRRLLLGLLGLVLIMTVGLVVWATVRTQEATAPALAVLEENDVAREDGQLIFAPDTPASKGLIYYPGGLVDPEAYAVTAQGIADAGYLVVVPKMPLNLAFTGVNKADAIRAEFPDIETWVIGGHSLGGAMAAQYAYDNVTAVEGLIMYASYPATNEDFIDFPLPILTVIASNDPGSPDQQAFYDVISDSAAPSTNNSVDLFIIEGGNHRQYADYSYQANDGIATITAAEQQAEIVTATVQFLEGLVPLR